MNNLNFQMILYFITVMFYIFVTYKIVIVLKAYLSDGADLRSCIIIQHFLFMFFFIEELFISNFLNKNEMLNDFLLRLYIIFNVFFITSYRLQGYRTLFFSKKLKNIMYAVMSTLFYILTMLSVLSKNTKINIYTPNLNVLSTCYMVIGYIFIIFFDIKEKRSRHTIDIDILMVISILLNVIITLIRNYYIRNIIFYLLLIIPICNIYYELNNILYYCRPEISNNNYLYNLFRKSYKLPLLQQDLNARTIAKIIESSPDLKKSMISIKGFSNFKILIGLHLNQD